MGRIRFYIALVCARLIYLAIRILNKSSGTSFVGMVTLKICPQFLAYCRDYVKCAITVSGTNGKSTTSGLLAHIIEVDNNKLVHNVKGANMLTGVANAFALKLAPFKHFDYAVIESDEAYLNKLYDNFKAEYLLVTNLFKDQLDRYGEISTTARLIQKAIDKNENVKLLLNADDPVVSNFGKNREVKYFGLENVEFCSGVSTIEPSSKNEVYNCICGEPLTYTKHILAQEGHYSCAYCGYKRPEPDFKGYAKIYTDYSELKVIYQNNEYNFKINLVGLYNAYNALASVSQALLLGINEETINSAFSSYKTMFGRAERKIINGHDTIIQLIKNPAGANEVLRTVDLKSNIMIAINDNFGDGRDISWLWDADFEFLKNAEKMVVTSGTRAKDMALRLKYAGIPQDKIIVEEDIKKAVQLVTNPNDKTAKVTLLPSYTALLKLSLMKF